MSDGFWRNARNPLHHIPRHLLIPMIVQPRRSRISVSEEILDIFEWHPLRKQVSSRAAPDTVRGEIVGHVSIFEATLEHGGDGVPRHGTLDDAFLAADGGAEEGRGLRGVAEVSGVKVQTQVVFEIVPHGDEALLAALLRKPQGPVAVAITQAAPPKFGNGPDPGSGVGQGSNDDVVTPGVTAPNWRSCQP